MIRRPGLTLLLVLGVVSGLPRQTQAHGLGQQQLERVAAGPFLVSAWTDPIEANSQDELHVTVALEDSEGLVLNADITITLTQDERILRDTATHEKAVNKLQYEGRFRPSSGTWQIEIVAQDGNRMGSAGFSLAVEAANRSAAPISIGWIIAGSIALILMGFAVINRRNLTQQTKDVL